MVVRVRFVFSDEERAALARYYGNAGLAPREAMRSWIEMLVECTMGDIVHEASTPEPSFQGSNPIRGTPSWPATEDEP